MPGVVTNTALLADARPRATRTPRPQPIRDAIMRFLTEPRSAGEIAEHIERPVPTATGHLGAMMRLGLVHRVGYGTYAPAAYCGPKVKRPCRRSQSSSELRRQLRELLSYRCSIRGLRLRTGESEKAIRLALRDLWLSGLVAGSDETGYTLARWQHQK